MGRGVVGAQMKAIRMSPDTQMSIGGRQVYAYGGAATKKTVRIRKYRSSGNENKFRNRDNYKMTLIHSVRLDVHDEWTKGSHTKKTRTVDANANANGSYNRI